MLAEAPLREHYHANAVNHPPPRNRQVWHPCNIIFGRAISFFDTRVRVFILPSCAL